ncbi:MAG TPA: signal peptidase I [Casimicrobiaceae bacterium]
MSWPVLARVQGRSMEPALRSGDVVLTHPVAGKLRRGDVVVLSRDSGAYFVKRVAGIAGDSIELEAGRLRVNGRSFDGRLRVAGATVARWSVPSGQLFVVGDNASVSDDSRTWEQPFVHIQSVHRALCVLPKLASAARPGRAFPTHSTIQASSSTRNSSSGTQSTSFVGAMAQPTLTRINTRMSPGRLD